MTGTFTTAEFATNPPATMDNSWVAAIVVKLLDDAGDILDRDRDAARARIAQAVAFLRQEGLRDGRSVRPRVIRATDISPAPARGVAAAGDPPAPARGGLAPWQMRRVVGHIDANLGGTIRMDDCADVARLSTRYFSRAFKSSFGVPPHAYVVQRRIQQAQHMMLTTAEPLCQIALACGLCDQAHFSKLFRRIVGISPSTWRRQWREEPRHEESAAMA
ncbi:MAG: AraC family transcriptional regulator [Azospirillaceae bacterium]|nr:AraC family transcriptional regulator [Azospirillaceae bacterium]